MHSRLKEKNPALCQSLPLVNRRTTFYLCFAAFLEIFSSVECRILRLADNDRTRRTHDLPSMREGSISVCQWSPLLNLCDHLEGKRDALPPPMYRVTMPRLRPSRCIE
jgi:hypothetical protein